MMMMSFGNCKTDNETLNRNLCMFTMLTARMVDSDFSPPQELAKMKYTKIVSEVLKITVCINACRIVHFLCAIHPSLRHLVQIYVDFVEISVKVTSCHIFIDYRIERPFC